MFSMCSELTPRAHVPDNRIPQLMQPWFTYWRNERLVSRFDLFFILVDDCNEVTDYAIARRIIDLHTKLEESVERLYSEDEVCERFPRI